VKSDSWLKLTINFAYVTLSLFCFSTNFFTVLLQIWRELHLRPNSPYQDTSLRPYPNKRPPTTHRTTLRSPFPPNHTLPTHPNTHLLHPASHDHTLPIKLQFNVSQMILSTSFYTALEVNFHGRVRVLNLGALLIIASVSLTHNPSLVACLHESMSCAYVLFSTCLSICVLCAACLVFCGTFISPFSISKHKFTWMKWYT